MSNDQEVLTFLYEHFQSIMENDTEKYRDSTSDELTLYEWFVTPHRIDGIPFHDFMMESNAHKGTVFGLDSEPGNEPGKAASRFDFSNLKIQRYGDTAIASYTLLLSSNLPEGVKVIAHNESRVMVKINGRWQVVHVHKSPAWQAPRIQP